MITISSSPKLQRIQQVKDTNSLLNILQSSSLTDNLNDFVTKFKAEYSEIAFERVLNHHFDNCIQSFLKNPANHNFCVINDFERIIETFFVNFPLFKGDLYTKKLIDNIEWNTSQLNLSNFSLIDPLLKENCKEAITSIIESEISVIIESVGICAFDEMKSNESIKLLQSQTDLDFETLLLNQYIQFTSKNIYGLFIDSNNVNRAIIDFYTEFILEKETIMINMINSIKKGLLNISNTTLEIIFILKEIIPIVRKIDPSGFVLDSCLKETRNYFKQFRKDLNSALLNFLVQHKTFDFTLKDLEEQQKSKFGIGLEYPPSTQADWKPDPIYVKTFINPDIRTSDPINVLFSHLSTCSSSSLAEFYQKQLSERLLKVDSIEEIEEIVEEVETFRTKCGESFVTSLNIMINDIVESRSKTVFTSDFKMTTISHRYWPEIIEKDLSHPEFILEKLSSISSTYSRQDVEKKIIWRPQLDEVKVSLEFPSGTFIFSCPLEAAILINSFDFPVDPEEEFDLGMAVALTGISVKKLLKNAMRFWLKKRIIISSCTTQFHFRFAQDYDPNESDCIDFACVLFDKTESETFADDDESSEPDFNFFKEKYWSILANMFKTFGQISAERIQSTLKMYSKEYNGSLDVLTKFLQSRVKEGVLQSSGNRIILYSLSNKH